MIDFKESVQKAKEYGACEEEIEILEKMSNWEELFQHQKAAEWIYWYARYIIKGRWIEAEKYIMKDPGWAYNYSADIIKGRWRKAEKYIMKDPYWAYWYSYIVIRGRWRKAEKYIIKNPKWFNNYIDHFNIKVRI